MASEKRELQRKNREKAEKKAKAKKRIWIIVSVVIAVALIGGIGYLVWESTNTTKSNSDFSAGLTTEGMIKNADMKTMVDLCDYNNIVLNYSDLAPTDEEVESEIAAQIEANKVLSTKAGTVIKEGDKINLDYTGKVDGVAFDNGSTNGQGTDIVLGSAGYIDDFEQQLMGTKVGDSYTIEVTFPEDYGKEELNGKDATFDITINGVYEAGKFDDEFVANNLSQFATTAKGYKEYYINRVYEERLRSAIIAYVIDNSTIKQYPASYLKALRSKTKYSDEVSFENTNQQYIQYFGESFYKDLYEFKNMKKSEYEASLDTQAESMAKNSMVVQAIYEDAGLTVTEDDMLAVISENWGMDETYYNQAIDMYGEGFIRQSAISKVVFNYLMENATVNK